MKKLTVILLLIFGMLLKCYGQDSSSKSTYSGIEPFKSFFQVSAGFPTPVGKYHNGKPFESAFASTAGDGIIFNILYAHKINKRFNFLTGFQFIKTRFDFEAFTTAYINAYQDTVSANSFAWFHLSLYTGVSYTIPFKSLQVDFFTAIGGLYTPELHDKEGNGLYGMRTNSTMYMGNSIRPVSISGVDFKFYLGHNTYALISTSYTVSSLKQRVVEYSSTYPHKPVRDIANKDLPISNLGVTFGLGTVFR